MSGFFEGMHETHLCELAQFSSGQYTSTPQNFRGQPLMRVNVRQLLAVGGTVVLLVAISSYFREFGP